MVCCAIIATTCWVHPVLSPHLHSLVSTPATGVKNNSADHRESAIPTPRQVPGRFLKTVAMGSLPATLTVTSMSISG